MTCLALIGPIGGPELLVILVIGLLIFGARLPEVGRSLGKGMMEFKRGLRGVQDEMSGIDRETDDLIDAELTARKNKPLPRSLPTIETKPVEAGDPQPEADPVENESWTPPHAEAARDAHPEPEGGDAHPADETGEAYAAYESGDAADESPADPRREPEPEIPDEPEGEAERRP